MGSIYCKNRIKRGDIGKRCIETFQLFLLFSVVKKHKGRFKVKFMKLLAKIGPGIADLLNCWNSQGM